MTKRFFSWLSKAVAAGLLAFALLCLFCLFYDNMPVHYDNPTGATEYRWEAGRFYSSGTEGFALGRTNNDGFNNLRDYTRGQTVDILFMGSSHIQGFNVAQRENAAAVLNELFDGEKYVYNIGTAGHSLPYCVKHLAAALDTYRPGQYVLLETMTLDLSPEAMRGAVDGTLAPIPSYSGGITGLLQRLPALRLLYNKYFKGAGSFGGGEASAESAASDAPPREAEAYAQAMEALLQKIGRESALRGVTPVLVLNPGTVIAADGSLQTDTVPSQLALVRRLCAENGVCFVDMTDAYLRCYNEQHLLPSGFSNTAPARGHLNRIGHRLVAEALYAFIAEREG